MKPFRMNPKNKVNYTDDPIFLSDWSKEEQKKTFEDAIVKIENGRSILVLTDFKGEYLKEDISLQIEEETRRSKSKNPFKRKEKSWFDQ